MLIAAAALLPAFAPESLAQASGMFGAGNTDTVSVRATRFKFVDSHVVAAVEPSK